MGILNLSGVSFAYGHDTSRKRRILRFRRPPGPSSREALRELDLDVPAGRVTAILGPNGAGKTTLLNICLGWLKPQGGAVSYDSRPLREYSRRELGQSMSLVPQYEHIPFEYSLLEYVLLGRAPYLAPLESPGPDDVTLAAEMIARVGLGDRLNASVLATSAGEKQLVMLARSLTQEPALLLLDEPSAHLDLRNKRRLIGLLHAEVERGATVLLTAHEPEFAAAVASHVVLMSSGQVLDAGPVDSVMTSAALSDTYDLPITVHRVDDRLSFHW
jgi:iron complex transport system ATP-binding protein